MGIRKPHLIVSINRAQRSRNILPLFDFANMEIIFESAKRKLYFSEKCSNMNNMNTVSEFRKRIKILNVRIFKRTTVI